MASGGAFKMEYRVEGIRRILRNLSEHPVFVEPWKRALDEAISLGLKEAQHRAPGTGRIRGKLTKRLQARPVPLWAKVPFPSLLGRGKDRRGRRFRITGALEGGARYHYRTGPLAGTPTRGWYGGVMAIITPRIEPILGRAARMIEQLWWAK